VGFFFPPIFPLSLYFVVLAYWVENVNNFLVCESRKMSFGSRMLLPIYLIGSIWNRHVVTTED
jgi:hypothetical protein